MDELAYRTIESYDDWYKVRDLIMQAKEEFPQYYKDFDGLIQAIEYYMSAISKLYVTYKRTHSKVMEDRIRELLDKANDVLKTFQQNYMLLILSRKEPR